MDEQQTATLQELLQVQKKQSRTLRVVMVANLLLFVILLVAAVTLIPRTLTTLHSTEESLEQVRELTAQAEDSLDGIDEMISNANEVLTENASGMNEAIGHFNDVDFDSLNQAIQDLSDTVAPLANLVRMFN